MRRDSWGPSPHESEHRLGLLVERAVRGRATVSRSAVARAAMALCRFVWKPQATSADIKRVKYAAARRRRRGRQVRELAQPRPTRTLVAFIRRAGSVPVRRAGPFLVSAEARGTDGPCTRPFQSCVQGYAGPSSGPYEARGLGLGFVRVLVVKSEPRRHAALRSAHFPNLPQIATSCSTGNDNADKLNACRRWFLVGRRDWTRSNDPHHVNVVFALSTSQPTCLAATSSLEPASCQWRATARGRANFLGFMADCAGCASSGPCAVDAAAQ